MIATDTQTQTQTRGVPVSVCDCGAGWATFSGHRVSCLRNAVAGAVRARIEREDYCEPERGVRIGGRFVPEDEVPTPAEL